MSNSTKTLTNVLSEMIREAHEGRNLSLSKGAKELLTAIQLIQSNRMTNKNKTGWVTDAEVCKQLKTRNKRDLSMRTLMKCAEELAESDLIEIDDTKWDNGTIYFKEKKQ